VKRVWHLVAALVVVPSIGSGTPTPAQKCAALKVNAAAKAIKSTLVCHKKAILAGTAVDPTCVSKADAKLSVTFASIEAAGGCTTTGDVGLFQSRVESCVDLFSLLATGPPCGDAAGPGGEDLPCACGKTVITNTTLDVGTDPVTTQTCAGNGLVVAGAISLNLNGATLTGGGVGTGIVTATGANVSNGTVQGFGVGVGVSDGTVTLSDLVVQDNLGPGLVAGQPCGAGPTITLDGASTSISDNHDTGIVIHPGASLTITGASSDARLPILRNAGHGIDVRGELTATNVEVGLSALHGVRVASDAPVTLVGIDVHGSGAHPTFPTADQAGIYVMRAAHPHGLLVQGLNGTVHDNTGHGVVLGHPTQQTGPVYGRIGDLQIHGNAGVGIRIQQKDDVTAPTASMILGNNIYDNGQGGVHFSRSSQRYDENSQLQRTFSGNDVHHNAVSGTSCHFSSADQTVSQIVFDGPIAGTDPTVSDTGPTPGPDEVAYPLDHRCYWGQSVADGRITSAIACNNLNDPGDSFPDSGGISNHCLWNGTQCRLAWDVGGEEGSFSCDSGVNRIFAYVNDPIVSQQTQKGIYATNGAYVRARRNIWGTGGASEGFFADSFAEIDTENDCGAISICP
jgi:hypothetical protein